MINIIQLKLILRTPGKRKILLEILRNKVVSSSELVLKTGLTRQTVNRYLKELESAGIVKIRRDTKPWMIILNEEAIKSLEVSRLLPLEGLPIIKQKLEFKYSWRDFPSCLIQSKTLKLNVVWGSKEISEASTCDAIFVPEIIRELIAYAVEKGLNIDSIKINSYLDIWALEDIKILEENMLVIGSGIVNKLTVEIQKIYDLPICFKPLGGRDLYSSITDTLYESGTEVGMNAGLIGLLPNPWNNSKVIILVAGVHAPGTQAGLLAILDHIRAMRKNQTPIIDNHPKANIPLRVIKAILSPGSKRVIQYDFLE